MSTQRIQCPVCCEYFARDFDLVLDPKTGELTCETNSPNFTADGTSPLGGNVNTDCGFHVPALTSVKEIRGPLKEKRIAELRAMGAPRV